MCCIFLPGHQVIPPDVGCFGNFRVQIPYLRRWPGMIWMSRVYNKGCFKLYHGIPTTIKTAWAQHIYRRHHRTPCWSSSRDWKRRKTDGVEPKKDLCATRKRGPLTHGRIDEQVPSGMRSKMEQKRMAVVDKEGPDHSGCDSNQSSKRPRGQHTCHWFRHHRSLANGKSVGAAAIACTIAWRRLRQTAFWSWEGRECAKQKQWGC